MHLRTTGLSHHRYCIVAGMLLAAYKSFKDCLNWHDFLDALSILENMPWHSGQAGPKAKGAGGLR